MSCIIHKDIRARAGSNIVLGPVINSKWPETLVHRIVDISLANPEIPAVKDSSGATLTYKQLLSRIQSIAEVLVNAGAAPGSVVAVFQKRTADWVASMLAIMHVGAIYLPLDPSLPIGRLASIVADCKPAIILTDDSTSSKTYSIAPGPVSVINCSTISELPSTAIPIRARADSAGVVFYTSGTTSTPKGILISHGSLKNEVEFSALTYGFGVERVLQQSAPSFDMSLTQIFAALAFGGYLYVCPSEVHADPVAQTAIMASEQITLTGGTPSEYLSWIKAGFTNLSHSPWRVAISGGEPIKDSLLDGFRSLDKENLRLFNAYGPTEVTCSATRRQVDYMAVDLLQKGPITAGRAAPNSHFYIANQFLQPVPVGLIGEIVVGGAGIALGYLNRANETAARFLNDEHATPEDRARGWASIHRTGDLGRMMPDGSLLVLGRIEGDTQVKLRGIRIDLSEIENAISKIPGIQDVVVSKRRLGPDDTDSIVAHVVASDEQLRSAERLQQAVDRLPLTQQMRPSIIILVDDLPRGQTGKVDRKAVAQLDLSLQTNDGHYSTDITPKMERMRQLWAEVIAPEVFQSYSISNISDFFHVGGNSLLLVNLQRRINTAYNVQVSLVQLFESSTLGRMAGLVSEQVNLDATSIDWEMETEPPIVVQSKALRAPASPAEVVVLSGATGHLGRELLRQLVENTNIREIHCIAVRQPEKLDGVSPKVHVYAGDLSAPRLGLSPPHAVTIMSKADVIIHNGANVSHLKHYRSLKADNVGSTRELVRLAAARRVPVHFVSTAGVALYFAAATSPSSCLDKGLTFGEVSVAAFPPPVDGIDGYTASKWAGEQLLERANAQLGLPVFIHRPSNIARTDVPELDLFRNLLQYCSRIGAVPLSDKLRGFLNLVPVEACARDILADALRPCSEADGHTDRVHYRHQIGETSLTFESLKACVAEDTGCLSSEIAALPLKQWTERAVEAGMHPTVGTYFNAAESGEVVQYPLLVRTKG